jgi:hypothetical protein
MSSKALDWGLLLLQRGLEERSIVVAPSPFSLLNDAMTMWIDLRESDVWQWVGVS